MAKQKEKDILIVTGSLIEEYEGDRISFEGTPVIITPLTHTNAKALRYHFPFTTPSPVLRNDRTIGLGDRLGIATPGHIRAITNYDIVPVFAQQSVRELTLTKRRWIDVLDSATYAVFNSGYTKPWGFDGDHLKTADEVQTALDAGCTIITLDCGMYINDFDAIVDFASSVYFELLRGRNVDFELSIDETDEPTSPEWHRALAAALTKRRVRFDTIAPRFCGEFQKGIDYIGDLTRFDYELGIHASIAGEFGYKLSIHSGSDKFSIFPSVGRLTKGRFHLKTAGTSWLEAMLLVAEIDPALYREAHAYALTCFPDAQQYYHVSANLASIPDINVLPDNALTGLFCRDDVRQLIHITYGFLLGKFHDRLYMLWESHCDRYAEHLVNHLGNHLSLLL